MLDAYVQHVSFIGMLFPVTAVNQVHELGFELPNQVVGSEPRTFTTFKTIVPTEPFKLHYLVMLGLEKVLLKMMVMVELPHLHVAFDGEALTSSANRHIHKGLGFRFRLVNGNHLGNRLQATLLSPTLGFRGAV